MPQGYTTLTGFKSFQASLVFYEEQTITSAEISVYVNEKEWDTGLKSKCVKWLCFPAFQII